MPPTPAAEVPYRVTSCGLVGNEGQWGSAIPHIDQLRKRAVDAPELPSLPGSQSGRGAPAHIIASPPDRSLGSRRPQMLKVVKRQALTVVNKVVGNVDDQARFRPPIKRSPEATPDHLLI